MSDSSRPHGLQPTRLLPPWDFPGKSTGVGCHWAHAKSLQSCLRLSDPMDCSLPASSVHRILQARRLEWIVMLSSRGSSQPRDGFFTTCATWDGLKTLTIIITVWVKSDQELGSPLTSDPELEIGWKCLRYLGRERKDTCGLVSSS